MAKRFPGEALFEATDYIPRGVAIENLEDF
jgi:hypothetical protein